MVVVIAQHIGFLVIDEARHGSVDLRRHIVQVRIVVDVLFGIEQLDSMPL